MLKVTGPLVAPSANHEGDKPALTVKQAQAYFGADVEAYIDMGRKNSKPSTLISFNKEGNINILRQGAVRIK